jgi:DNA/RNA-binding domain of Phe-tRNA-synthetase-like protein
MTVEISAPDHPLLRFGSFEASFPESLGSLGSPSWLIALLALEADAPFARDEDLRRAVRDMLRHAGYRPTGRGKPASEYLVRAASEGGLDSINLAVDACNAVSLHSGLPISVVDHDLLEPPLRIAVAPEGARYVFNAAGQDIDLAGLLCLCDAHGPCANAVKDSQRTKTHSGTRRTLSVIWGAAGHEERLERAVAWYRSLIERAGARTE